MTQSTDPGAREPRDEVACARAKEGPPSPKAPWLLSEVRILAGVNFVTAVGFGIQSPAIPVLALQLGVGAGMVGLIISAFALGRLLANVPGSHAAGRWGGRRVLTFGLVVLAITSVLAGLSQTGWQLALFRGICGVGSALYSVAGLAVILRATPASSRGKVVGLYMGAFYVGAVSGPALGALLVGLSPRVPFFAYGAAVGASALVAYVALRRSTIFAAPRKAADGDVFGVAEAASTGAFRAAFFCNFVVGWCVYGVRVSVLPVFLLTALNEDARWIGISLAGAAALQALANPLSGMLTDRFGRKPVLALGQVSVLTGTVLIVLMPSLHAYLACFALFSLGAALTSTSATAFVGDLSRGRPGGAIGFFQTSSDFGMLAGPAVTGLVAQQAGFEIAFLLMGLVALAGVMSAIAMRSKI